METEEATKAEAGPGLMQPQPGNTGAAGNHQKLERRREDPHLPPREFRLPASGTVRG